MKFILIAWVLVLNGCAYYNFENGDCKLKIVSMREVKSGDIRISKNCSLTGGAEEMSYNEQQLIIMQKMVEKIP